MHLNLFGRRASQKPGSAPVSNVRSTVHKHEHASSKNQTIESLARMRDTVRDLEKRENFLSVKAKAQYDEALAQNKAGNKQGAITAMTRKKMYEKEVLKLMQTKANLEAQMLSIESANVSMVAHEGMQAGLYAQRLVTANMNPDEIAELHQDIEEHLNQADEVSNILATGYNAGEIYDEDALLAELNADIEGEQRVSMLGTTQDEEDVEKLARMMETMPTAPEGRPLPIAPTLKVETIDDDQDELRKLEREMGL